MQPSSTRRDVPTQTIVRASRNSQPFSTAWALAHRDHDSGAVPSAHRHHFSTAIWPCTCSKVVISGMQSASRGRIWISDLSACVFDVRVCGVCQGAMLQKQETVVRVQCSRALK